MGHVQVALYKEITEITTVSIVVKYSSSGEVINTLDLPEEAVSSLVLGGYCWLGMSMLLGTHLVDGWYNLEITVDGVTDYEAGFGYTAEVAGRLYYKTHTIQPYSPDYRISQVFHAGKMLLDEMDALENINVPQRVYQFEKRLALLNNIIGND